MANLKKIEKFLKSKRIGYEVKDLGGEVFTVDGVKNAGINEEEIVKTLIIRTNDGFKAFAVRGQDRVDFKKVRLFFGGKSELARAVEVEKVAKVPVGAVCPIQIGIPLYLDEHVMKLKRVSMGSGDLTKELEMEFDDFIKSIGGYKVEDLVIE